MSRIGKLPVILPAGVTVEVAADNTVSVKGPLGTLSQKVDSDIKVEVGTHTDAKSGKELAAVLVTRPTNQPRHRSLHGLYRALINNMVIGVSKGYEIKQELVGVGFKAEVKDKCAHRCKRYTEIADKLNPCLGVVCVSITEMADVCYAVIGLIGLGKLGVFAVRPIKSTAVNDTSAYNGGVTVHIFGGGMDNYIRAKLKGAAVNGRREGVIDHKRNAVAVRYFRISLDIENIKAGVCERFAEQNSGSVVKERLYLVIAHIACEESRFDAKSFERNGKEVDGSAVDRRAGNYIVTRRGYIKYSHKYCRHSRCAKNRTCAAFKIGYLFLNLLKSGVGNS